MCRYKYIYKNMINEIMVFSLYISLNESLFSSTYGYSTSTPIPIYKSYIRSLFDYGAPATYNVVGRGYKHISFREDTTTESGSTFTFHSSMTEPFT